jgi:hypothetical protein
VVSLRLDQHCDFIAELSVTASKEQAIEVSLGNIASTWASLQLDMAEYKGTHKLLSTEDIFAALEDNGVTLSTMKASKYYLVFEAQVAHWERTLALASETVEMILQVRASEGHPVMHACLCTCWLYNHQTGPACLVFPLRGQGNKANTTVCRASRLCVRARVCAGPAQLAVP